MRRCESCHSTETTHAWLPYRQRHLNALTCEACHIPKLYAPARQLTDWTVLDPAGAPRVAYRSEAGWAEAREAEPPWYRPVLLPRRQTDGAIRLTPHNLITSWYWVAGERPWPVSLRDLRAALLPAGAYHPDVAAALDANADGSISESERALDTPAKVEAIRRRLQAVGVEAPRIQGEIQPFSLHHNVASGPWATRQCGVCHGRASRVTRPFVLAPYVPGEIVPRLVGDADVHLAGRLERSPRGALVYAPDAEAAGLYILGHDQWALGDRLGMLAVVGVLGGILVHAALRVRVRMARLKVRDKPAHGVRP